MKNKISFSQILFLRISKIGSNFIDFFGLGNSFVLNLMTNIRIFLRRIINPTTLGQLEIYIAEHCNLSCFSCHHFSQLAVPEFADLAVTERDLKRFSELSGGYIPIINLSGGEPLLHPQLPDFMRIAREFFPDSKIKILTNGLLLLAQKDLFWEAVKKYNIAISPTKYPGINWEKIEKNANTYGCKLEYAGYTRKSKKMSRKYIIDLLGKQNAIKSFKRCYMAANCTPLKNGRIATCHFVFSVQHFNNYFNQHIPVNESDSIDIYKVNDMKEIIEFVNKPIPLCAYCKSWGKQVVGDWREGEKLISDWT